MGDTHRNTQPPSKVLHIRNLPHETTEEELAELCAPFGPVVQTKLNVGPNRNQAFIEFMDQSAAIQMVSFYGGQADPAKVRGKTVYIQYSTRHEIVNSRSGGGEATNNVLLVSLEHLVPDCVVTIETLHLVFSAFGFVHKIATFEKGAGFQALVQYGDAVTAEQVRIQLDGRHIPKDLLNGHPSPPSFKISFSQHSDLNVKFQSHRSRDYTNAYLPVAPSATDPSLAGHGMQSSPAAHVVEGNILLCTIDNQAYPVTVEPLHTVFSPYGQVHKIAVFEKNGQTQALVQYADGVGAGNAKAALEGHAIYDGGYNKLKISFSHHRDLNVKANNERSWDYTGGLGIAPALAPATAVAEPFPSPQGTFAQRNGAPPHAGTGLRPQPAGDIYAPGPSVGHHAPRGERFERHGPGELNITGQDYEIAHDGIAKAAQAAARGGQAPPAYNPAPIGPIQPQYAPSGPPQYRPPAGPQYQQPPPQQPGPYQQQPPPQQYGGQPPPQQYGGQPPPQQYGSQPPPQQYGSHAPPQYHQGPPQQQGLQYGPPGPQPGPQYHQQAPPQQFSPPPQQYGGPALGPGGQGGPGPGPGPGGYGGPPLPYEQQGYGPPQYGPPGQPGHQPIPVDQQYRPF